MKSGISLICLDFDGTVVDYDGDDTFFHPVAIDVLNDLAERNVSWCTNSGRDVRSQRKILILSQQKGLRYMPAAMLCSESLIYQPSGDGYVACEPWNSSALILLKRFHERVQALVSEHLDEWQTRYNPEVHLYDTYTVFNLQDTGGQPARFAGDLFDVVHEIPHVQVTRNGGWVMVLPEQMGKGNVLREYLKRAGMGTDSALAIGDHMNDLSMLDGTAAKHVGCPANAVPEVLKQVREAGGFVASASGAEGTVEVIRHFLGNGSRPGEERE